MASEIDINKVAPIPSSVKRNNFISRFNVADRLKYLINMELFIGINRVYLLDYSKTTFWITQVSTPFLLSITIYLIFRSSSYNEEYTAFRNIYCIEVLFLCISGSYLQRNKLRNFFLKISEFDTKLNLQNELITPRPLYTFIWTVGITLSVIIDYVYTVNFMKTEIYYGWDVVNLGIFIHECEKLFFCVLLYAILIRIRILEKHVAKTFGVKEDEKSNTNRRNKIDKMQDKVKLDLSSLHEAYLLLQNVSEHLNSSMSFSMIVMFSSSGINTIMFLNYIFNENTAKTDLMFNAYIIEHCIKLTLFMMIPCYLANDTSTHVTIIRGILHDALDDKTRGKAERRKIKAFHQLTHDSEITYVLWGLIKLDMYFPLSYSSLCTTYLVIVLQYSKFIV
ncbi:uncharacterized protein [Battus philenor]|uniref:uncharacterized protein n=1 Tax=Battus philenor TaxID=42288 RepID=UPI0035CFEAF1